MEARTTYLTTPCNTILHGDCIQLMHDMRPSSIDFILTDPPYLVNYRDRDGRSIPNDNDDRWLRPAFSEMYRVLKWGWFCVSFYAWNRMDRFLPAWRNAGFRIVGHVVFRKHYASSVRFLRYQHEMAYLLAKGAVTPPSTPIPDVIDWTYTGNRLHPTQKPVNSLKPLIQAFCKPDGIVLDPFCGSGSTLVASKELGRSYIGMELVATYYDIACDRLGV